MNPPPSPVTRQEIEDDAAEFESDIRVDEEMQREAQEMQRQENVRNENEHMDIVEWEARELRQAVNSNPEVSEWFSDSDEGWF